MRALFSNLKLLQTITNNPPIAEFVATLKIITKNNPWCDSIDKYLRSGNQLNQESISVLPVNQTLLKNLPIMLIDLREHLISQRVTQLSKTRQEYLEKSIDYLRAGEKLRSSFLRHSPYQSLKGTASSIAADISTGDLCGVIKSTNRPRVADIRSMRLDAVNSYWIDACDMINKLTAELDHPTDSNDESIAMMYIDAKRVTKVARLDD